MTNIFSCFRIFQFFSLQRTPTSFEKGPLETNVAGHIFPMINFNWSRRNFEILSHFNFDTHTIQTNVGRSQFSQNHVLDTYHESYLSYDNFWEGIFLMIWWAWWGRWWGWWGRWWGWWGCGKVPCCPFDHVPTDRLDRSFPDIDHFPRLFAQPGAITSRFSLFWK